jgi:hypothetical protein
VIRLVAQGAALIMLFYLQRPAVLPIVSQQAAEVKPASTLDREHPFVRMLEAKIPAYRASGAPDFRDFLFVSCAASLEMARLCYVRVPDGEDASGEPRLEFLFFMFQTAGSEWRIVGIEHMFGKPLQMGDHFDCMQGLLDDNDVLCISDEMSPEGPEGTSE